MLRALYLALLLSMLLAVRALECTDYCSVSCDDPECDDRNECTIDIAVGSESDNYGPYAYQHPQRDASKKGCDHIARPPNTTCTIRPLNASAVQGKCCDGLRLGCSDLASDVEHCGACGNRCRELILGAKSPACCDSVCVDLSNSRENCGMCNMSCSSQQSCIAGVCTDPSVPSPSIIYPPPSMPSTTSPLPSTTSPLASTTSPLPSTTSPLASTTSPLASTTSPLASTTSPLASTTSPLASTTSPSMSTSRPSQPMPAPTMPGGCKKDELRCNGQCIDPWNNTEHCGHCDVECGKQSLCVLGVCVGLEGRKCRRPSECSVSGKGTPELSCNTTLPSSSQHRSNCCIRPGSAQECVKDEHCCGQNVQCDSSTASCCKNRFATCESNAECCGGQCDSVAQFCCVPLGEQCQASQQCCGNAAFGDETLRCVGEEGPKKCCIPASAGADAICTKDQDCCDPLATCNTTSGFCGIFDT